MKLMKVAKDAILFEHKLAHYSPAVAEEARRLMRETQLTSKQALDRAIRTVRP